MAALWVINGDFWETAFPDRQTTCPICRLRVNLRL